MERHEKMGKPIREWGAGKIHDSMSWFYRLGGSKTRTPGDYFETDSKTQKPTKRRLENTNEYIHSSVRIRMGRQGLGYNDKGKYDSEALQGWTMNASEDPSTEAETPTDVHSPGAVVKGRIRDVRWVRKLPGSKEMPELVLLEDTLGDLERRILQTWPELSEQFDTIRPVQHATSMRRSSTFPDNHPHSASIVAQLGMPNGKRDGERVYKMAHRQETI